MTETIMPPEMLANLKVLVFFRHISRVANGQHKYQARICRPICRRGFASQWT